MTAIIKRVMPGLMLTLVITGGAVANAQENPQRVLGQIDFNDQDMQKVIEAPERVRVGQDFQVTITTFGGGCEEAGDTGVITAEKRATIFVYDFTTATRPGVICTTELKRLPHVVTLRFTEPGEGLIEVWGRHRGKYTAPGGAPAVLQVRIPVEP